MIPYILIFGVFVFLSWIVQSRLKNRFEKYSKVALPGGQTGADIARIMLSQNGITDVKVQSVGGELTDHYNPLNKTINLSPAVYNGRSVMSAAVAAHETGHALQHAQAYAWLQMRSQLVPVVSISSKWMQWVLLAGILTIQIFPALLLIGIIMFGLTTLFSLITLPVEFDASRRALVWLQGTCLLYTSPSPRDRTRSRMPSSA